MIEELSPGSKNCEFLDCKKCGAGENGVAGPCSDNDLDLGIVSEVIFIEGVIDGLCSHPLAWRDGLGFCRRG